MRATIEQLGHSLVHPFRVEPAVGAEEVIELYTGGPKSAPSASFALARRSASARSLAAIWSCRSAMKLDSVSPRRTCVAPQARSGTGFAALVGSNRRHPVGDLRVSSRPRLLIGSAVGSGSSRRQGRGRHPRRPLLDRLSVRLGAQERGSAHRPRRRSSSSGVWRRRPEQGLNAAVKSGTVGHQCLPSGLAAISFSTLPTCSMRLSRTWRAIHNGITIVSICRLASSWLEIVI